MGLGLVAVGVQDLDLVSALHPHAAVAVALHRLAELHVQVTVAELLLAADVALIGRGHALVVHGPAGRVFAAPRVPVVSQLLGLAAEEHDGPLGRLHQELGIYRDLVLGLAPAGGAAQRPKCCKASILPHDAKFCLPCAAAPPLDRLLRCLIGMVTVNDAPILVAAPMAVKHRVNRPAGSRARRVWRDAPSCGAAGVRGMRMLFFGRS